MNDCAFLCPSCNCLPAPTLWPCVLNLKAPERAGAARRGVLRPGALHRRHNNAGGHNNAGAGGRAGRRWQHQVSARAPQRRQPAHQPQRGARLARPPSWEGTGALAKTILGVDDRYRYMAGAWPLSGCSSVAKCSFFVHYLMLYCRRLQHSRACPVSASYALRICRHKQAGHGQRHVNDLTMVRARAGRAGKQRRAAPADASRRHGPGARRDRRRRRRGQPRPDQLRQRHRQLPRPLGAHRVLPPAGLVRPRPPHPALPRAPFVRLLPQCEARAESHADSKYQQR